MLDKHLIVHTEPKALKENIVLFGDIRVTVLSDRLFRIECDRERVFCDEATQSVWFRNAPAQSFKTTMSEEALTVRTSAVTLVINRDFEKSYVVVGGKKRKISNEGNLLGTYRTLDKCLGAYETEAGKNIELENGVLSKNGVAVIDDTKSLILGADGKIAARRETVFDYYVFAFGREYRDALKALYAITGSVPKIPKYALGNWWSRYYEYTDKSYLHLLDKFEREDVPLTVATIDMDWHYSTKMEEEFGLTEMLKENPAYYGFNQASAWKIGWTGYTWNKHLFPDYKSFLKKIEEKNLKITLNLHPADGVRFFEDCYEDMAKAMGVDPKTKQGIPFNITDDNFINNYFKILHKPYEHDGVRFWWIDWQQGTKSDLSGLDPLWSLNHYHYLDNGLEHEPLILSRYCGVGSHRYPLGFSGDTHMEWKSLEYIPYFTATASNVGYTWWSHDIGGHFHGVKDDELYLRYLQFGVFSPINRLHCSKQETNTKEPWVYRGGIGEIAERFLRLRHKMIPYLYSASINNHKNGVSLIEPMYYDYPDEPSAYKFKNQYMFGGQLLVAPITKKTVSHGLTDIKVWVPDGRWTDIFTGDIYEGGKVYTMLRTLDSMPVLAKAGGVFPTSLDKTGNSLDNPHKMNFDIFNGNGEYTMYEDADGKEAVTVLKNTCEAGKQTTEISIRSESGVIPNDREYTFSFPNIESGTVHVFAGKNEIAFESDDNDILTVTVKPGAKVKKFTVSVDFKEKSTLELVKKMAGKVLVTMPGENDKRSNFYRNIMKCQTIDEYVDLVGTQSIAPIFRKRLLEFCK